MLGWGRGLEVVFECEEELFGVVEGLGNLDAVVEGVVVEAELLFYAVEGVAAVAGEVVDVAEEGDVAFGVVAGAFLVFVGADGGEFCFPVTEQRGVDVEHLCHFADGVIEFVGHRIEYFVVGLVTMGD